MITQSDLRRLMHEYEVAPDSMYELLETWGVDPVGFRDFGVMFLDSSVRAYTRREADMDEVILTALMCGFILGYKTAMEVETRREVDGNEIQGS